MTIELARLKGILDCRESPTSPELLDLLSIQLQGIFNRTEAAPVLIFLGDEPYFRFAILENPERYSQVALEIRGTKDPDLVSPPNRLFIRLFEKLERKLTRVSSLLVIEVLLEAILILKNSWMIGLLQPYMKAVF